MLANVVVIVARLLAESCYYYCYYQPGESCTLHQLPAVTLVVALLNMWRLYQLPRCRHSIHEPSMEEVLRPAQPTCPPPPHLTGGPPRQPNMLPSQPTYPPPPWRKPKEHQQVDDSADSAGRARKRAKTQKKKEKDIQRATLHRKRLQEALADSGGAAGSADTCVAVSADAEAEVLEQGGVLENTEVAAGGGGEVSEEEQGGALENTEVAAGGGGEVSEEAEAVPAGETEVSEEAKAASEEAKEVSEEAKAAVPEEAKAASEEAKAVSENPLVDKGIRIQELLASVYDFILHDDKEQALQTCGRCFDEAEDLVRLAR